MVWQLLAKPLLGVVADGVKGFVDTKKAGIIDPTKVVTTALRYATSAGLSALTTEAAIAAPRNHEAEFKPTSL